MKYFGTKQVAEIDEDAVAIERLMAIAGRFKADRSANAAEGEAADSQEGPQAPDQSH